MRHTLPTGVWAAAWAIAKKDLRIELRTREIVTTAGFFAVLIAIMASVAFYEGTIATSMAPGALWLSVAFASILAFGRTWQREREDGALTGLLVAPIPRAAIFIGKAAGVSAFVFVIEGLVVPLVALMFHVDLAQVGAPLVLLLVLGNVGVIAMGTLFGAMTARTRARDLILASVLFPLLSPALLSGVAATRELFSGATLADLTDYFWLLGIFDAVAIAGGLALFGPLFEE